MKILADTDGHIVTLPREPFEDEEKLRSLLQQYPDLVLAGTSDEEGRKIWVIGREVGVPSGSIDLLLLDSTGHLWVVEVKLDKNPEARKKVVGQVLAYASDVATWTRDDLEEVADFYLESRKTGPSSLQELLIAAIGEDEADTLLDTTVTRLHRGDLTALVAVDELNTVLRRLVEFVNSHAAFELLALKIETVTHAGSHLYVPTVVGTVTRRTLDPQDQVTVNELLESASEEVKELARRLDALAEERGWVPLTSRRSQHYQLPDGDDVIRFYPRWASITLDIGRLRRHGLVAQADHIQALVTEITGKPQGKAKPAFSAETLIANWNRFIAEVLPPYLDGIAKYRERKSRGE